MLYIAATMAPTEQVISEDTSKNIYIGKQKEG